VRGEGKRGEAWHRAGRLETKPNTIACAEHLIREGWTRPMLLAGLWPQCRWHLIGGAITTRPDLFGATVIVVGVTNALRFEQLPIGPFNTANSARADERGFQSLLAVDAYQAVRPHVAYPSVLLTTNDSTVSAWMPGKMAARLQAVAGADWRPVLLRVNEVAGHANAGRAALEDELADRFSFLLWQAGVAAYH
jgi:prolyl oligopeptidase